LGYCKMADASPADTPVAPEAPATADAPATPATEVTQVLETTVASTVDAEPTPKKRGRPPGSKDKTPGSRPSRKRNPPSPVEDEAHEPTHQQEPSPPSPPQEQPQPQTLHPKGLPELQSMPELQPPEIGVHEAWDVLSRHLGFQNQTLAKQQWASQLLARNFH
jgi:hypothetical protein